MPVVLWPAAYAIHFATGQLAPHRKQSGGTLDRTLLLACFCLHWCLPSPDTNLHGSLC